MERNRRPPSDVEEALSSMLWTPYQRTPSNSSSDDDDYYNCSSSHRKSTLERLIQQPNIPITAISDVCANNDENASNKNHQISPSPLRCTNFVSNYGNFFPKSYNNYNRQLPSYEHVQKERGYFSIGGTFAATGNDSSIYNLMPPSYSKCTSTTSSSIIVHSFTDDFAHYQVIKVMLLCFIEQSSSKSETKIVYFN